MSKVHCIKQVTYYSAARNKPLSRRCRSTAAEPPEHAQTRHHE